MLADLPPPPAAVFRLAVLRLCVRGPSFTCAHRRVSRALARSAARQPAACARVLVARAHLIGSELKVIKLEEFFSILPYTPPYIQNQWLMDQGSIFINTSSIQSKF